MFEKWPISPIKSQSTEYQLCMKILEVLSIKDSVSTINNTEEH